GVGERARARAVFTDRMVMMDAVDGSEVASVPVGEAFRKRFGNPYAVIHRADVHQSLLEGVQESDLIDCRTSTRVVAIDNRPDGVTVRDQDGNEYRGAALIGCDGVRSVVRQHLVGDDVRVSGHVV